jgi:hypothetical protein
MFDMIESQIPCDLDNIKISFMTSSNSPSSKEDQEGPDTRRPVLMKSIGNIGSKQCNFNISFEINQINLGNLKRKIVNYSIMNNALSLILIKLYIDQMRVLDSNSSYGRVSMGSIIIQAVADSLDSMLNFFTGLSVQFLFNLFIIMSLFKFILFSFFEMRLIRYLVKNKAEFPIFTSHENRDTDLRPQIDCHMCVGNCFMNGTWTCGYPTDNGYNNSILVL